VTQPLEALRYAAAAFFILVSPVLAAAQTSGTSPDQGGPMTLEQVQTRGAITPEYKVSDFDGTIAQLVGAHGGMFVTPNVLVGAGFYTQVNGSHGRGLTYGGGVVSWQPWTSGRFGLNLRTLVGFGSGTTSDTVTVTERDRHDGLQNVTLVRRLSSDFFVAEPYADVLFRLTRHLQLGVGAGYRATNPSHTDSDRFNGATGAVTLQIGSAR